jgi:hypothetical protein
VTVDASSVLNDGHALAELGERVLEQVRGHDLL